MLGTEKLYNFLFINIFISYILSIVEKSVENLQQYNFFQKRLKQYISFPKEFIYLFKWRNWEGWQIHQSFRDFNKFDLKRNNNKSRSILFSTKSSIYSFSLFFSSLFQLLLVFLLFIYSFTSYFFGKKQPNFFLI